MKYQGGCHCGAVRFEVDMEIEQVLSCNCSICIRKGHLLAFTPRDNLHILQGEDQLADYQFGPKVIHHQFCRTCGVGPLGHGKAPDSDQEMAAINVRCLDDVDLSAWPVMEYDGKSV